MICRKRMTMVAFDLLGAPRELRWWSNWRDTMNKRVFGANVMLGGSTAALAMLTGLAGARADDLQVNQQLLNNRIDQLASVGLQPGAGAMFSVDQNAAAGAAVT